MLCHVKFALAHCSKIVWRRVETLKTEDAFVSLAPQLVPPCLVKKSTFVNAPTFSYNSLINLNFLSTNCDNPHDVIGVNLPDLKKTLQDTEDIMQLAFRLLQMNRSLCIQSVECPCWPFRSRHFSMYVVLLSKRRCRSRLASRLLYGR